MTDTVQEHVSALEFYVPPHIPPELVKPFDLFDDPGMAKCPFTTVHRLRERGRVFWNPTNTIFRGSWVLTHAEDLREVLTQPDLFSNKAESGFVKVAGEEWDLIPLELDPPRHTRFRQLLNPLLSPVAVTKMANGVAERAIELIEAVRDKGKCDFMQDFAVPFPVSIFMQLMGLPREDMDKLLRWEAGLLHTSDNASMQAAAHELGAYLKDMTDRRRANPADDIASYVVSAKIEEKPLTEEEIKGVLYLLFLAGLDTVGSTMGFFFKHLADHPDQQQQLREDPDLIPRAIEEMLRRYSIITPHRQCTRDVEVAGVQMKEGDWITILTTLGSTDPQEFESPLEVQFDRKNVRHFGFNFGPHFCMGAHLARRELEIALREWLTRIPMWRVKPGAVLRTHGGHTFGYENLDLIWDVQ
jgi:cytochrome P450